MAIAVFNPADFKLRYPVFSNVSDTLLAGCFDDAGFYLSNSDTSPVQDIDKRTRLLWMLTAHIAAIGGALSASNTPAPVGRVSSATEGSVNISLDFAATPGSQAWYSQTQWGLSFWQATLNLRSFQYVCQPLFVP